MSDQDFDAYMASLTNTPVMASVAADAARRERLDGVEIAAPRRTRIITVANQKGGVGKTTSTVNLAAALAESGLHVVVVDMDPQGNASTALGVPHGTEDPTIYDVLVDDVPMREVIRPCPQVDNLDVVPSNIDLAGSEIELVAMSGREMRLRKALRAHIEERRARGRDTDYVLIDCPPSLGLLTINAFTAADEVLIPIQCEYYALEGVSQLVTNIGLIQQALNPRLRVSTILLTMFDSRTKLSKEVATEVREHFPGIVLEATIPRSVRIAEAPSHGETVITYDPYGTGSLCYREAAAEIADRGANDDSE